MVVLAGITGACDRTLRRGEVVEVVTERIAGIPERYAREYETSGPDLGLPLAAGVTVSRSGDGAAAKDGPKSAAEGTGHAAGDAGFAEPHPGFTADDRAGHAAEGTHHQTPEGNPEDTPGGYLPEVENMEGAAFSPYATRWASRAARYVPCRTTSANPSASGPWRRPSGT